MKLPKIDIMYVPYVLAAMIGLAFLAAWAYMGYLWIFEYPIYCDVKRKMDIIAAVLVGIGLLSVGIFLTISLMKKKLKHKD